MDFYVGDRVVSILEDYPGLEKGEYGTVVKVRNDGVPIIKWDKFCESRHDADGSIPQGHGWFVLNDFIELAKGQVEDLGKLPEDNDIKFLFGDDIYNKKR